MHPAFRSTTAQLQGLASASEPVSIIVSLKLPDKDLLDSYIVAQNTPGSPAYHQWLSSTESADIFGPTAAQAQAVADYLTQSGFTHVKVADNRLLVTADGTVTLAQKAFNTQIGVYSQGSQSGLANTAAIQVPTGLTQIDRVLGLDTMNKMHTHIMPALNPMPIQGSTVKLPMPSNLMPEQGTAPSDPGSLGVMSGGLSGAANPTAASTSYYPEQFATVYNTGGATAKNTTVAIIGWGSMTNPNNDLALMELARGIAWVPTSIVYVPAGSSNDDSAQIEWGMDAQAIVGITRGVKKLIFYTSGDKGGYTSSLLSVINRVVNDNTAKVINMSWGLPECMGEPGWADSAFALGAAQGQTFSASSGDKGSYPCGYYVANGSYGDTTILSAEYPASSPYVIAIGGTTLTTGTNRAYVSESAWAYSGGGVSAYAAAPSWQSSLPIPPGASNNNYRQVPDLAFDADPSSGGTFYYIADGLFYDSFMTGVPQSGWYVIGGTSLSSPLFTGIWAILQSANGNNMGFAPPVIYSSINSFSQNGALHDITNGNNGYYSTTAGYDNATGWGSLNIAKAKTLINKPLYYTITATAGAGGSVSPTSASVYSGMSVPLTITPNDGYVASSISGSCGGQLNSSNLLPWPSVFITDTISADCDVKVMFTPTPSYTVTPSVSGIGGTISPAIPVSVKPGEMVSFILTPDTGYAAYITGTCGGMLVDNVYSTAIITSDCIIVATFAQPVYLVSATPSSGGKITGGNWVKPGATASFTIAPDPGYYLSSAGSCDGGIFSGSISTGGIYTTNPVTADCSFYATFAPVNSIYYTITARVNGAGGKIDGKMNSIHSINSGGWADLLLTPDPGYAVSNVDSACGGFLVSYSNSAGLYYHVYPNIYADCDISVTFVPTTETYTVTPIISGGGTISPSSAVVKSGARVLFTLTPDPGYAVSPDYSYVTGGCSGILNGNIYIISGITGNSCAVTVEFVPISTYTVTPSIEGGGGTISPSTAVLVPSGNQTQFTLTPDPGYEVYSADGTCAGKWLKAPGESVYVWTISYAWTISGATDCTLVAKFVSTNTTYTVTPNVSGGGGTISPSTAVSVPYGSSTLFTLTPDSGYTADLWKIIDNDKCSGTLIKDNIYTTGLVPDDCAITAYFTPIYTVTPGVSGGGGTIYPSTPVTVKSDSNVPFRLTPDPGYGVDFDRTSSSCPFTFALAPEPDNNVNIIIDPTSSTGCSVTAYFRPMAANIFTVTVTSNGNSRINPESQQQVNYNRQATIEVSPSSGYHIASITGDTCTVTLENSILTDYWYTTSAITADCLITVTITQKPILSAFQVTTTPTGATFSITSDINAIGFCRVQPASYPAPVVRPNLLSILAFIIDINSRCTQQGQQMTATTALPGTLSHLTRGTDYVLYFVAYSNGILSDMAEIPFTTQP
ncbi:MAG: hypothetical protein LBQ20_05070 [Rhodanobacter sp.]|jgi:hypothetical protein|nr:hypothetical protein [Rhodanobacter sp.]